MHLHKGYRSDGVNSFILFDSIQASDTIFISISMSHTEFLRCTKGGRVSSRHKGKKRKLFEHSKIRLGQEEDGLAGRESRERSTSTELGTPEGARAHALEVRKTFLQIYPSPFVMFCMFSLVSFLFYFYFLAAGQDRRKGGSNRDTRDRVEQHSEPVYSTGR